MSVPTQGEKFAEFIEHIRKAQEASAMLAHLAAANDDKFMQKGWLAISEMMKLTVINSTKLATGRIYQ